MSQDKNKYSSEFTGKGSPKVDVREWISNQPCVVIMGRQDGDFEIIGSEIPEYKVGTIIPRIN